MNKRIRKKKRKQKNRELCERYPFLIPRHIWTGDIMWNVPKSDWQYTPPYSFTELDCMPVGWRKAFGEQMCEEIREELIKANLLNKYRIAQIKEKFGGLRWYDDYGNTQIDKIIGKYEQMSERTCICCGRPVNGPIDNNGWIEPICDKCLEKISWT